MVAVLSIAHDPCKCPRIPRRINAASFSHGDTISKFCRRGDTNLEPRRRSGERRGPHDSKPAWSPAASSAAEAGDESPPRNVVAAAARDAMWCVSSATRSRSSSDRSPRASSGAVRAARERGRRGDESALRPSRRVRTNGPTNTDGRSDAVRRRSRRRRPPSNNRATTRRVGERVLRGAARVALAQRLEPRRGRAVVEAAA